MNSGRQTGQEAIAKGGDLSPSGLLRALSLRLRMPLVRFFQRRVRNGADAEDLAQEVFERLARHEDLGVVEHLDGYVFTMASNLLRDRARKQATHAVGDKLFLDGAERVEEITPERVLLSTEAMDRFLAALAELPDRTRTILLLRRYEGLDFKEIAQRLAISVSTAEKHMVRAMNHLSRRLDLK